MVRINTIEIDYNDILNAKSIKKQKTINDKIKESQFENEEKKISKILEKGGGDDSI